MKRSYSTRPRIAMLGKYPPVIGGIESHVKDLSHHLADRASIQVIAPNNRNQSEQVFTNANLQVLRLARVGVFSSAPICLSAPRVTKQLDVDLIHLHAPNPMFELSLLKNKTPYIITHHSDVVRQKWLAGLHGGIYRKLLANAKMIISSSHNYVKHSPPLQEFQEKVRVVPMGIHDPGCPINCDTTRSPKLLSLVGDKPYVLAVGRLVPYKGFDRLIQAAKYHRLPTIIIGSGPLKSKLERQIVAYGLENRVFLIDHQPTELLQNFYHHCYLFALSSITKNEAFGIVQVEAMAHAKPVVLFDITGSGVTSPHEPDITGLITPLDDIVAFGQAIEDLANNPLKARSMGLAARNNVLTHFSMEVVANRIWNIYLEVLPDRFRLTSRSKLTKKLPLGDFAAP